MDDQDRSTEDQSWADLLSRLPAVWAEPEREAQPAALEYGERLLAAARVVARGG